MRKMCVALAIVIAPTACFAEDWVCSTRGASGLPQIQKFAIKDDEIVDLAGEKLFKSWGVEAALPVFHVVQNDEIGVVGVYTSTKDRDLVTQMIMINKPTGAMKLFSAFATLDANVDVVSGVCELD